MINFNKNWNYNQNNSLDFKMRILNLMKLIRLPKLMLLNKPLIKFFLSKVIKNKILKIA
jgi:hypothetical protein